MFLDTSFLKNDEIELVLESKIIKRISRTSACLIMRISLSYCIK